MRDYGTGSWTGGDAGCDHIDGGIVPRAASDPGIRASTLEGGKRTTTAQAEARTFRDECGRCGARRVDAQLGLEATPSEYVAALVAVFAEVWRVLRDDGTLWLNLGDSYASGPAGNAPDKPSGFSQKAGRREGGCVDVPRKAFADAGLKPKDLVGVPWRVAFALQEAGWYLRSDIVWSKSNPMPESVVDRPTKAHEYVFLLAKQPRYFYDADAIRETALHEGRVVRATGPQSKNGQAPDNVNDRRTATGFTTHDTTVSGRNARSVWEIATQPTAECHFATYPEALVRRCILAGTSEAGGCAMCGAPWQRVVERGELVGTDRGGNYNGREIDKGVNKNHGTPGLAYENRTTGWAASCQCGAPPVPQTVLDPFVGSGTTALVARKHGRRAVGIDLSDAYLAIAARRLGQQSLFATSGGVA